MGSCDKARLLFVKPLVMIKQDDFHGKPPKCILTVSTVNTEEPLNKMDDMK